LIILRTFSSFIFLFTDTPTPAIYTLSLHDALPIFGHAIAARSAGVELPSEQAAPEALEGLLVLARDLEMNDSRLCGHDRPPAMRSEEHTSELQSRGHLVCRLLLEKKKSYTSPIR